PARSADRARTQGGGRLYQQPRGHRRLPAVPLARQVSGREPADTGTAAHGAPEVRPPVQELIFKGSGSGLRPRGAAARAFRSSDQNARNAMRRLIVGMTGST